MSSLHHLSTALLSLYFLSTIVDAGVLFSTLKPALVVEVMIQRLKATTGVVKVGEDFLDIRWTLSSAAPHGIDVEFASVKLELCFFPVSQVNRGWRNTKDDLQRDKTCLKHIATQQYTNMGNSVLWRVPKDIPGAVYFVRAYVLSAQGVELAYGQSTDDTKSTNLISVIPITGRHRAMDVAGIIFSLFSVGSLFSFLAAETWLSKKRGGK